MTVRDLFLISAGNLVRMKLRSFLTISGVIIAIAAFVAMLSFGAGMQENVSRQFSEFGLLHTIIVYPSDDLGSARHHSADSSAASNLPEDSTPVLNQEAIEKIMAIPGVELVYPFDAFDVRAVLGDTSFQQTAQAMSVSALGTKLFSRYSAGKAFDTDSSKGILISEELARDLGFKNPDSLIGQSVTISLEKASLDSAIAFLISDYVEAGRERLEQVEVDSLFKSDYLKNLAFNELNIAAGSFFNGLVEKPLIVADTLYISGVLKTNEMGRSRALGLIIPIKTARHLSEGGFSADPLELFSSFQSGSLFGSSTGSAKNYPKLTLDIDPYKPHKPIVDSLKALGYHPFSYAQEFEEIKRFFVYFDMGLAVVGLIALFTASLGIANTLIMSIIERRREIGILKSLGADDIDIKLIYLFESGMIGLIGSCLGIVFGWIISRIASFIIQKLMEGEDIPPIDFFSVPLWLIGAAVIFGVTVAVLAGLYPASRASRINPVEALRNE